MKKDGDESPDLELQNPPSWVEKGQTINSSTSEAYESYASLVFWMV